MIVGAPNVLVLLFLASLLCAGSNAQSSRQPTRAPILWVTATPYPTRGTATLPPTRWPSPAPSVTTRSPIRRQTPAPTFRGSQTSPPSRFPSQAPGSWRPTSWQPSTYPTRLPTSRPTGAPIGNGPSSRPTRRPTPVPTQVPSDSRYVRGTAAQLVCPKPNPTPRILNGCTYPLPLHHFFPRTHPPTHPPSARHRS